MRIGVLALQGAFAEHLAVLARLGVDGFEIRERADLNGGIDGLILPGGESTVMGRLLRETGLFGPLKEFIQRGLPVFGTCAGMILLARRIENDPVVHFGTMDITVRRNAYGRQLGSFHTAEEFHGIGRIPMTFIRAPYITEVEDGVRVLATVDGNKVAAECGKTLVTSFHPELTEDLRVHRYFLGKIR
ncbi:MAG: pyridoxal 5'-phosphate synthase glutaminase subunit PdxT [Bacillota bacterium]|jgi:5'-phosphate synthase pdxT subunit|nr:pyridoxal 5'-phosphate synthase glutaminase subunit PdxT [Bacillota bacterium]